MNNNSQMPHICHTLTENAFECSDIIEIAKKPLTTQASNLLHLNGTTERRDQMNLFKGAIVFLMLKITIDLMNHVIIPLFERLGL